MRNYVALFILVFVIGCGDQITNNYYYNNDGEWEKCPDNDCEEILHPDDNTAIAETDQPVENETTVKDEGGLAEEENDSDEDWLQEESEIETQDDTENPDIDIPEDVCVYIKSAGILDRCFQAQDGEKIYISDQTEIQRCKATVESTVNPIRYFYGIELPFNTEDNSSTLDYNTSTQKVFIDTKEFTESSC